ncbi:hypothetical protein MMPV_000809 [Pyropia vietnamensis]
MAFVGCWSGFATRVVPAPCRRRVTVNDRRPALPSPSVRRHLPLAMLADPPIDAAEWTALEADLRAYLASPAALPPPLSTVDDSESAGTAPPRPPMPLAYANLVAAGRYDLADRIGRAGGYVAVSRRLGLPIDVRPPPVGPTSADVAARIAARAAFRGEEPGGEGRGFLTLGAARDARVGNPTALAAGAARARTAATGSGRVVATGRTLSGPRSDKLTPLRKGETAVTATAVADGGAPLLAPPAAPVERVEFDAAARIGLVLVTALSAAAYGRATGELLSAGTLSPAVVDGFRVTARAAVAAHLLSAPVAAVLAGGRGRRRGAWAAKAAAGGLMVVAQLRRLPPWAPTAQGAEGDGGGRD